MISKATTPKAYLAEVDEEKKEFFAQLRETVVANIPKGFSEEMSYGMIGYVVPHSAYPAGYHCNSKLPLPFVSIAAQKNSLTLYHMGIYANPKLLEWFTAEYVKQCKTKLDMGKGCIRFKKPEDIPYKLIGELMTKISVKDWIAVYESHLKPAIKK